MNGKSPFRSDIGVLNEGLRPFDYWQARALAVLKSWRAGEDAAGYKTGLVAVDNFVRLVPSEVTIVGARPGMGKTALAMQWSLNMLPDPGGRDRIAFFSAEMSGWSLYMRIAAAVVGVTIFSLRSGEADDLAYDAMESAIRAIAKYPLLIDDRDRPSTAYMRDEMYRLSEAYDVRAMYFDFMELSGDPGINQEQRLSSAMGNLKEIAKEFQIPVIALSHLSREVESRGDKIPQLDDLRYSGMIEQLADQVILMTRPRYYLDNGVRIDMKAYESLAPAGTSLQDLENATYLFIAKNRNGAKGIARVYFDAPNMRFYDLKRITLNKEPA